MDEKTINKIAWWIPIRKLRDLVRKKLRKNIKDDKKYIEDSINNLQININNLENKLMNKIKRVTTMPYIEQLDIHLVEHCNMACYGCLHFSQLAEKKFLDFNTFIKDIEQLSRITSGNIYRIHLLGGEPLLNKNCSDYFYIVRKYFPDTVLRLFTNGILLLQQDETFWNSCKKNKIDIVVSRYSINLDWNAMVNIASKNSVNLSFTNDEFSRYNMRWILSEDKMLNHFDNFVNCLTNSIQFKNGNIYRCCVSGNIEHFNKYFNKQFKITDLDYVNIYNVKDYSEILEFLSRPIPFCGYCNINKTSFIPWSPSKRSIYEYMEEK